MKSKTRRLLESWHMGKTQKPTYIATGAVFIYPSDSGESTHHVVVWMHRKTPKNVFVEFVCSCRGFGFSHDDVCRHVLDLKKQLQLARIKQLKEGR